MGKRIDDKNFQTIADTGTGACATYITQGIYNEQWSYTASNQPEYYGFAKIGTGTDAEGWLISKTTYSGMYPVKKRWSNNEAKFDKVWSSRTSYNYN